MAGSQRFKGKIRLDVRDSEPDWSAFASPKAPKGAPNLLYIVWDDTGFGAWDLYGGLIEVPAMRRLAEKGLLFTQFHTTALCSPTRSCLLNGRNATSNGMACITEASTGFPGSNGHIPFENALISEVLVERGWSTFAVGKWHLTPAEDANLAGNKRLWPLGRGFERYYGFLGGDTNQWYPDLTYDNHPIEPPYTPEEGYHLSKDLADKAISFIQDNLAIAPTKPWMMYFCPGAAHAPHHVWKDWADRYKGKFDMGYERYREIVLANQKTLGLVPQDTQLPALNPYADIRSEDGKPWAETDLVLPWETLSEDEKRLFTRMAEVYAGFVSYTDAQIGRLLDFLEETDQLANTVIVVVSDNGASAEGGPHGSVNENKFFNGIPDSLSENLKHLDDLGGPSTYNHYPSGWALAFNTPFKLFKRYSGYQGGTADAMLLTWPQGISARGEMRDQYLHAIDLVPTLYDLLGLDPPGEVKGYPQSPIEGVSFKSVLMSPDAPTPKDAQFYAMLGTRGIWAQGWHANTVHPPTPSGWGHFETDIWELYHLETDRSQVRNLAETHPDTLEKLKSLWYMLAGKFNGLPLDDRTAVEILTTPRPKLTERNVYLYYPGGSPVPEAVAPEIVGRSFNIAADVILQSPEAEGVLFAEGSRFGGHVLFIKDRKLNYLYNFLGENEQLLTSRTDLPTGHGLLGLRFRLEGRENDLPVGTATLYLNDQEIGERRITVQPGGFDLAGGKLRIGRDGVNAVTTMYPAPFAFKGGTITLVAVDVSGKPYRNLEKEWEAMLMRD